MTGTFKFTKTRVNKHSCRKFHLFFPVVAIIEAKLTVARELNADFVRFFFISGVTAPNAAVEIPGPSVIGSEFLQRFGANDQKGLGSGQSPVAMLRRKLGVPKIILIVQLVKHGV